MLRAAASSGVLLAISDCAAQLLETTWRITSPGKCAYNFERTARMALTGTLFVGPFQFAWLHAIHRYTCMLRIRPRSWPSSIICTTADQAVVQPFGIYGYLVFTGILERKNDEAIHRKIRTDMLPMWERAIVFWVPVQLLNFRYNALSVQPLFVYSAGAVWYAYMSIQYHIRDYSRKV